MSIFINDQTKEFHLTNASISYIIHILRNGQVGHLYFGKALRHRESFQHLYRTSNRILDVYPIQSDSSFSLERTKQEYPSYGTSDFREGTIEIKQENGSIITDFRFKGYTYYSGKPKLMNGQLPSTFCNKESDATTLEIELEDTVIGATLVLSYTLFENEAVITRNARIMNVGSETIRISRALSCCLDFDNDNFEMLQLSGAWSRERHLIKRELVHGIQSISSTRGASSANHNPFMALKRPETTEHSGEAYGFSLVYSGNFLGQVEVNHYHLARVTLGINPMLFEWKLSPKETFQTPEAILVYSDLGLNGMSQTFHHLFLNHLIPKPWHKELSPVLLNSWEAAYYDFNEDKLFELASKASTLGMDLFVLDDGWFKNRNSDHQALGDWIVDKKKLPNGLGVLSDKINQLGMKFGLWIEPEMVNEKSDLYKLHPEWVIQTPERSKSYGRNQFVLNYSNPEVVDTIFKLLDTLLSEANIEYIKWDMNRNISEPYALNLPSDRQGEFFHRYILGVYSLYQRLRDKYPYILFESCAAGGGRFDPGMLYYAPQVWTSDDTDAVERIKIQYGTSYIYPIKSLGAHITAVPNHQILRKTSLKMRNDVAIFGTTGYELDVTKLNVEDEATIKEQIKFFKRYQALLHLGDFYRLISPFEAHNSNLASWMCVSQDRGEAIIGIYQTLAVVNPGFDRVRLRGLDPELLYRIKGSNETYYGDELMSIGLSIEGLYNGICEENMQNGNEPLFGFGDFTSKVVILETADRL